MPIHNNDNHERNELDAFGTGVNELIGTPPPSHQRNGAEAYAAATGGEPAGGANDEGDERERHIRTLLAAHDNLSRDDLADLDDATLADAATTVKVTDLVGRLGEWLAERDGEAPSFLREWYATYNAPEVE